MSAPRKPSKPAPVKVSTRGTVLKDVQVRFQMDQSKWAVLDPETMNGTEFFDFGYMKHVVFTKHLVQKGMVGCGGSVIAPALYVGIARGDLVIGKYHRDTKDAMNLGFNGQQFFDKASGDVIIRTPLLHLMPDRRALGKRNPVA